jgi:co-chaperonin GroES (HSP10)
MMATQLKIESLNGSGLQPLDQRVVVLPDPTPDKIGNVIIPDQVRDQKKFAMQTVTVVAVGEMAWAEAKHDAAQWGVSFRAPVAGDRVRIGKYSGDSFDGNDGQRYILLNDTDVLGHLV